MCESLPRRGRLGFRSKPSYWFDMLSRANPFRGFKAIGIFLFFGAALASLAGATLIWRGSVLDRLWALHRRAYHQLALFGSEAGVAFLVLGDRRSRLVPAPVLGVGLGSQTVGSAVNAILGDFWEGATGSLVAGAILSSSPSASANLFPQQGFSGHRIV